MIANTKVLVLNQDYTALSVCSVAKAFLLVYLEKADMLSPVAGQYIHTVSSRFEVPSIIRLRSYVHFPYRNTVVLNRQNIFKRDNGGCVYCDTRRNLTLDHVMPSSRGGRSSWENLVTACKECNSKKGNLTPQEAGMPMLRKPFRPSFVMYLRNFTTVHTEWINYLGGHKL